MRPVATQMIAANLLARLSPKARPAIRQAKVANIADAIRPGNVSPEPGAILRGQVSPTVRKMITASATRQNKRQRRLQHEIGRECRRASEIGRRQRPFY